jgi:hypothetical protein
MRRCPLFLFWALVLTAAPASAAPSSQALVSSIMALLAVFEQANVLPSESSADANALIHALIQTQAALTKSTQNATRLWFADAMRHAESIQGHRPLENALTSRTLEAILAYAAVHPPAQEPAVLAGLIEFNVRQTDFDRMAQVYYAAKDRLRTAGQDMHVLYEEKRQAMTFR